MLYVDWTFEKRGNTCVGEGKKYQCFLAWFYWTDVLLCLPSLRLSLISVVL
jgi:hypothetical protein